MGSYLLLKTIHMSCAMFSISGLILRGYWMITGSPLLKEKLVKILPHIIDTVFLFTGLSLVFLLDGVSSQAWLHTKVTLLVVYIVLGFIALRKSQNKTLKISALFMAILVFAYIFGVAVNKNPGSWFV